MNHRQSESSSDIMHHPSESTRHRPEPPDEIDVDPLIERVARPRKQKQAARVLEILDSLPTGAVERRTA